MAGHRLDPLLRPRSVAIVGASARTGSPGNETLVNLRKGGFGGQIYLVNPARDSIAGMPCYHSLCDLPQVPEHAVLAVGERQLEACLDDVLALGVPAATIFSGLQDINADQPGLRERIRARALAAGLLLHGGNCMGLFNITDGVWISGFDTRQHHGPGNAVLLSQSGAGMSGILDCEQRIQFSFAASTGQELCLSVEDYLDYVLDQPHTRVVGLFLETSRQPEQFIAALAKAQQRRIPVVALKVGATALAAELAISHSGALAGSDATYQAVFDRYGVQRVADMAELATAMILFSRLPPLRSGALVTMHDSGGERQLAIDLAHELRVPLTELSPATVAALREQLDPGLPAVNPLDAWGSGGDAAAAYMEGCFTTLLGDPGAALGAVIHDRAPGAEIYESYLQYIRGATGATAKPAVLVANYQGSGADPLAVVASHAGIPVVDGLRPFLVAARCLLAFRDHHATREETVAQDLPATVLARWRELLLRGEFVGEDVAAALLTELGLPMAASERVESAEQLAALAPRLRYPVVLKTAMPGIAHKADVAGVVLGLADFSELEVAYSELAARLGPQALVATMVSGAGEELLLGIARDAQFGPTVVIGMGGAQAELLRDSVVLLPPFSAANACAALKRLQLRPLLDAFRGRPALAVAQFCEMAARLSHVAVALADCLEQLDINPVRVMEQQCIGLDALVIPLSPATRQAEE